MYLLIASVYCTLCTQLQKAQKLEADVADDRECTAQDTASATLTQESLIDVAPQHLSNLDL